MDEDQIPEPTWRDEFLCDWTGETFFLHLTRDEVVPIFVLCALDAHKSDMARASFLAVRDQLGRQGIDWELFGQMLREGAQA